MNKLSHISYGDKNISCSNCKTTLDSNFKYVELNAGEQLGKKKIPCHYLIMQISGVTSITYNEFTTQILGEWQMIAIPKLANFKINIIESAKIVVFGFNEPLMSCRRVTFDSKSDICDSETCDFIPTEIKRPLQLFLTLLSHYLSNNVDCSHIHELKHKELAICIKTFYTTNEYIRLLWPVMNTISNFKSIILDNYEKFSSINEMITATNMSRSQFFVRFKKEFGVTAKQWMLKHQTHQIQRAAARPNISVKELMLEFGFGSSAQFTQFCRLHFGCTPVKLIEAKEAVNQQYVK